MEKSVNTGQAARLIKAVIGRAQAYTISVERTSLSKLQKPVTSRQ